MPGGRLEKRKWCAMHSPSEQSFVHRVQQAFLFLGLSLSDTLTVSFAGKQLMPVWDLSTKDLKPLLQRLARRKC